MMRNVVLGFVVLIALSTTGRAQDESPLKGKEIGEKLAAVEREIARLREADSKAQPNAKAYADDLARRLQRVRNELAGKPLAAGEETTPELHVVGVYQGAFPDGPRRYGVAAARVEYTGRPIVLCLCAYEHVRWTLEVAEGVKLQKIILAGIKDQLLENPPPGIPLEKHTQKNQSRHAFYVHSRYGDRNTFEQAAVHLKELTGLPITTLIGRSSYVGHPLLVGRGNDGWVYQRAMTLLDPLHMEVTARQRAELRQRVAGVRFSAIHDTGAAVPFQAKAELADFTVAGPIESSLRPLPAGARRGVVDPRGPSFYALAAQGLSKLDLKNQTVTDLPADGDFPELSHPCALAFDTKRNRVVLATLGGEGYLYVYDTDKNQWSLLRSLANIDLGALTYCAEEDCFYGIGNGFGGDRGSARIFRYRPDGSPAGNVDLQNAISEEHPAFMFDTPVQVSSVGDHLVVLAPPPRNMNDGRQRGAAMIHVIDPRTGKAIYSGEARPTVAPEAAAGPDALPGLWNLLSEAEAEIAAKALVARLAGAGDEAVKFIRANLPRLDPPDPAKIRELLARLDQEQWKDREEATAQLLRLAGSVEPQLRAAHAAAPSEEVRGRIAAVLQKLQSLREMDPTVDNDDSESSVTDPTLRTRLRAVRILYRIATPAAVEALRDIAAGPPGAINAEQAKVALQKL